MPTARPSAFAVPLLLFAACATAPPAPAPAPLEVTLVVLSTGPRQQPLSETEQKQVMGGHLGNIQRLVREGSMLFAGPFGRERSDPSRRGLFVLDTADPERARELAESDPGARAGVFALSYHSLTTAAPLRACHAADLAAQEAAAAAGRPLRPGDECRVYVCLTARDGAAAEAALTGFPGVLCFARLDGTSAFVLLDARDRKTAQAMLQPVADRLGECRLDEWYATERLAELPRLAAGRDGAADG